ncbi:C2H2 zinc finger protein [Musa troglodytarum]|uniref:C2H2 zinc finger protein n=1 Tax=Musa troglodytarum TaxID=320322 RepID=A0A9E7JKH4_9LILI|nr:C2H2 zinc finger protein [Musa troglodytarum]
METPEDARASNSSDSISNGELVQALVKGKRTKRPRSQPPPPVAVAADASSVSSAEAVPGIVTEEEEDMANCLILLAQGRALDAGPPPDQAFAEAATTTNGKAGFYVYECKTCNKCFPSFQALGGHRTSHKKPKLAPQPTTAAAEKVVVDDDMLRISMNSFSKPIGSSGQSNTKPKIHECSICGSEFSSGQALGGHMRRHRPLAAADAQEAKKDKSFLSLDLNLPAPADEELHRQPSPSFTLASKRPLIFPAPVSASASASASALVVDCHY